MESWFTHALSAIGGGGVFSTVLWFVLRYRQQSQDSWHMLLQNASARITALEARLDHVWAEHLKCLEAHADMRAKVAVLEAKAK